MFHSEGLVRNQLKTLNFPEQQQLVCLARAILVQYSVTFAIIVLLVALFAALKQYSVPQATSVQYKKSIIANIKQPLEEFDAKRRMEDRDEEEKEERKK